MAESRKPGAHNDLEQQTIRAQDRPALDEATFQQLLEAAHVIQELKAFEVVSRPKSDPAEALAKIVETQDLLRSQTGDLQAAANLIAERLQEITHATGVAIAVMRENQLEYCAATGDAASLAGSRLATESCVSPDGQLSTEFIREIGGKSSMALPLHHEGKLAGLLEVRFVDADSIQEPEIRSCQLMAGLMTEAIARAIDKEWRQTLASERAAMLEALERIKPQLERLAVGSAENPAKPAERVVAPAESVVKPAPESAPPRVNVPVGESRAISRRDTICPQCGYQFGEQELFCGRCGIARPAGALASADLQSKYASRWHQQQALENQREDMVTDHEETDFGASLSSEGRLAHEIAPEPSPELKHVVVRLSDGPNELEAAPQGESGLVIGEDAAPLSGEDGEPVKSPSPWASATNAQEWLESVHPKSKGGIWLAKHRADLYVGAAVLLLLIVISGWGMRPAERSVQAKNPPQPNLTLFERLLVSLGLAETPPTPIYRGNPNAQVWVDLHTALYYCADSELYGKTPGGKFTTQRDAQLDQFEPAARKDCN